MTRQDIAVVGAVALATAVVALGIEFTGRLVADESPQPEIRWPVLKHGAVEITLRAPQAALAPGVAPSVELEAVNESSGSESFRVTVCQMSQPSVDAKSRMGPISRTVWTQTVEISLDSCERKTFLVSRKENDQPAVPLPAQVQTLTLTQTEPETQIQTGPKTLHYFTLSDGKTTVSTRSLVAGGAGANFVVSQPSPAPAATVKGGK